MIDVELLLNDPTFVAAQLARKGTDPSLVKMAAQAVLERREAVTNLDALRARLNRESEAMRDLIAAKDERAAEKRSQLAGLKSEISEGEARERAARAAERELLLQLPNLPDLDAPDGQDESANKVVAVKREPLPRRADAKTHWDIADEHGWFDAPRAAKISGSGFSVLRGDGARLLRALVQLGLDLHRDRYEELVVPHFVKRAVLEGTGHLPKFADDAYELANDELWAIPTGEVPLTALHRDELFDPGELPRRYMTHTACFRREAGSAGKDTRGMQRVHEFHKVELVVLCSAEHVQEEYAALLEDAAKALELLELPYRVVDLCTGDLTFSSSRIFDLEVYSPGVDKWLEVSSVGNFTDFQARRSNIRERVAGAPTRPVHTLNGSGLATPRVWAALLEHGLQEDGTVRVPGVLVPYLGTNVLARNERWR